MITRQEYLNNSSELHNAYHEQFVTYRIKQIVLANVTLTELLSSTDKYLNDINIGRWDSIGYQFNNSDLNKKMRDCGDYTTQAGLVCIAKAAARLIINENKK